MLLMALLMLNTSSTIICFFGCFAGWLAVVALAACTNKYVDVTTTDICDSIRDPFWVYLYLVERIARIFGMLESHTVAGIRTVDDNNVELVWLTAVQAAATAATEHHHQGAIPSPIARYHESNSYGRSLGHIVLVLLVHAIPSPDLSPMIHPFYLWYCFADCCVMLKSLSCTACRLDDHCQESCCSSLRRPRKQQCLDAWCVPQWAISYIFPRPFRSS